MKDKNIIIYKTKDNKIEVKADLDKETLWLNLNQIAELFNRDKSVISRHIKNVYSSNELKKDSTVAFFATVQNEGGREISRDIEHFSLDLIISVGYRVNSKEGTQFRIWATNVLRKYLVEGYAINQKRLEENNAKYFDLQKQLKTLRKVIENESYTLDQSKELVRIITDYADSLDLLDKFDHNKIDIPKALSKKQSIELDYDFAVSEINRLREEFNASELFGNEKDNGFKSALKTIFQTFDGKDLYPSIEEKSANLLYLIIKNHPFSDGNKRIGAFMFIRFLDVNKLLYRENESKLVEDNALVAIALLIAQSDPKDKELLVRLVVNLIV